MALLPLCCTLTKGLLVRTRWQTSHSPREYLDVGLLASAPALETRDSLAAFAKSWWSKGTLITMKATLWAIRSLFTTTTTSVTSALERSSNVSTRTTLLIALGWASPVLKKENRLSLFAALTLSPTMCVNFHMHLRSSWSLTKILPWRVTILVCCSSRASTTTRCPCKCLSTTLLAWQAALQLQKNKIAPLLSLRAFSWFISCTATWCKFVS